MHAWTIALLGVTLIAVPTIPGIWCWWPSRGDAACRRDLGVALMTGSVVAGAILGIQILFDARIASIEHHRQAEQRASDARARADDRRSSFALAIGMAPDLSNMDFKSKDMSGLYLAKKNFAHASFIDTRLEKTILAGARLDSADFTGAHLEGAHLDRARLTMTRFIGAHLRYAVFTEARLQRTSFAMADLRDVDLRDAVNRGATFTGARYNAGTRWPKGVDPPRCKQPICFVQ